MNKMKTQEEVLNLSSRATDDKSATMEAGDALHKWSRLQNTVQTKLESLRVEFHGLTGREVFAKLGIPYCHSIGAKIQGKALMAIRQCLKQGGYPGAGGFSLSALPDEAMWDEICDAVGIKIPGKSFSIDDEIVDDIDDVLEMIGEDSND